MIVDVIDGGQSGSNVLKPAMSARIVIACLWVLPLLFTLGAIAKSASEVSLWTMLLFVCAYAALLQAWLSRFRIEYDDATVRYRTLFGGWVSVPVHEIKSAKIAVGVQRFRDRFSGPVKLELETGSAAERKIIALNVKVFRLDDIKTFLAFLKARVEPT